MKVKYTLASMMISSYVDKMFFLWCHDFWWHGTLVVIIILKSMELQIVIVFIVLRSMEI